MTKEYESKDGGAAGNIIDEACACCSGCCGIPQKEPDRNIDPTEEKQPTESAP